MAVIRKEIAVKRLGKGEKNVYDCMVEETTDLTADEMEEVGMGSIALCLSDGNLYAKKSDDTWEEVQV